MSAMEGVERESRGCLKPAEPTADWLEKQMPLVSLEELKKRMMEHEPQRFQEKPEESKRFAVEHIDACFAKLQEETKRFVMEYTDACFAKLQEETKKPAQPTPPPPGRNLSVQPNGGMDELRMKYMVYNPQLFEEYREGYKRDAMEYMDACFAKLQETIRPGVEYELISVPFIDIDTTSLRAEGRYTHIHFKAKRQNASPHHQRSPEAFCAVILKNDDGNPVLGCNHLANYGDNYPSRIADQENCLWARDYEYPTLSL